MKKTIEMQTPLQVETIPVIYVLSRRGDGTNDNPVRHVHQYWSEEGNLLAEKDEIERFKLNTNVKWVIR